MNYNERIENINCFLKRIIKRKKKYINIFCLGFSIGILFVATVTYIVLHSSDYPSKHTFITTIVSICLLSLIPLIVYIFIKEQKIVYYNDIMSQLEKEREIKTALFHLNHEIKNPLAVVKGYLDMMERTTSKEKLVQYQKIIKEEINRSITIINDFSTLGRIKELNKEPLDLSLIFDDIKEILSPLLKKENGLIHTNCIDELYIEGDYDRLKQAFINIIKNSIESKDKDFLIIDIKIRKLKNSYKISIIDNGKGMNNEILKHIDETFYSTKQNGTGIGMAYVKKIIEMHKGKIEIKSKEKKGTTVVVGLPSKN